MMCSVGGRRGGGSEEHAVREEAIDLLAGEPDITNWEEL